MADLAGIEVFTDVQRLIVIAAHPDDLETMCGGTIAMLVARGVEVFSVNCTLRDIGTQAAGFSRSTLAANRLAETEAAARILGIQKTYNLEQHDGELVPSLALRAQIARLYRITQADTLFTFDPYWTGQIHPDHRAAAQAALDAYMPSKMPLYHPEHLYEKGALLSTLQRIFVFSSDRNPTVFVDVNAVYATKIAASLAHQSQFPNGAENLDWMKALDTKAGAQIKVTYAEAFKQLDVW